MKGTQHMKLITIILGVAAMAHAATLTVEMDKPGIKVSPTLYGIFFEEINRAGDGGLYAEMIQNRSFEDAGKPDAWTALSGTMDLDRTKPLNGHNPTCLRLDGRVANEGFHGIAVRQGKAYRLSLYAQGDGALKVSLEKPDGAVLTRETVSGLGHEWKKYEVTLTPSGTEAQARLVVDGKAWIDMVSLFPGDAVHGIRPDLFRMLSDMKPAFVRFPGGCYVEGARLSEAFRWKKTIGDVSERPGHHNLWGYYSNDGLGYHEYLQLCEDLGSEPLYVINCGMSHEEQSGKRKGPQGAELQEYVQDALDAIEYANGPVTSKWGALRAKAGHAASFGLKFMEIGNENGGPMYHQHYALFHDAIKAKYPDMKLIANDWQGLPKNRPLDIIDSHAYTAPDRMRSMSSRYDGASRTGPKVYFGEYAVTQQAGRGNLQAAVAEAAFMTGLERNSDVVVMSSYAPLFECVGYKRWNPNAILFNAAQAYATPSWHVQALFGRNRADVILPVDVRQQAVAAEPIRGMIGVGTWLTRAEFKDISVTRDGQAVFTGLDGWKFKRGNWQVVEGVLRQTSDDKDTLAMVGDPAWTDYTVTLKARKISGSEGFMIHFGLQNDRTRQHWNLGGWGNKEHGLEIPDDETRKTQGEIEVGRWYEIRIEIKGAVVTCYLDGKKMQEATRSAQSLVYAVAGRSDKTGETILKVVNAGKAPVETTVELRGAKDGMLQGRAMVLSHADPLAENSFGAPDNVAPKTESVKVNAPIFGRIFPAHSVTVLRLNATP